MNIQTSVGEIAVTGEFGTAWKLEHTKTELEPGLELVHLHLETEGELPPPQFSLHWFIPLVDIQTRWAPMVNYNRYLPPNWSCETKSNLASSAPIMAFLNQKGQNRFTMAISEAIREVKIYGGVHEERCDVECRAELFTAPEAPLHSYDVTLRFDTRGIFYADAIRAVSDWFAAMPAYKPSPAPAAAFEPIYSSWYSYHQEVFDKELEAECALAKEFGMKGIIVDDGWQYCYGEWDANSWFPSGMEHLAKELTKMGFEPGLWFAPAIAEPHSRIAQLDYDMLAGSVGGQPCLAYECMRRVGFILDPTVRKTEKFLEDTFRRYADMGYKYFKLDFLCSMFNAPRFSDPNIKRDELIPRLLAPVWRGINGRSVLLGCNYPYTAGNSMVEAVRIGADIHARWDNLTHNLPAVASHFWANKKLWLNDPDFALCRSAETSNDPDLNRLNPMWPFVTPDQTYNPERNFEQATMNRSELEILLSLVLAAAGAVNLSDKMTLLNEQGLFLARKVVSAESGEAARPLDLFSAARPARFLQKLKSGWRVLLVNWGETAEQVSFDLAAHGVRAASATDFWAEKPVSISSGRLEFELAPHSCKLIELN